MTALASPQTNWDEIEAEETRLLRAKSVAESLGEYLTLQREFELWLVETEPLYRTARNEAMIELQARLEKVEAAQGRKMDDIFKSVAELQSKFEQAGLPSMVIGGLAVGIWGEPRLTRDADIKVLASRADRQNILDLLAAYTPLNADPDDAFRRNGIAFFQSPEGVRVDVMLADNSLDETALGRAKMLEVGGNAIRFCTAEDLIVYKVISTRERDRLDVQGIIKRQGDKLDDRYVEQWLAQLQTALTDSTLLSEYRRLRGK